MARKAGSISRFFVWILLGLLIVGLAGFGAVSFTGNVRSFGSVGDRELRVETYARELQNAMRAASRETGQPVTVADAQAQGLTQEVLSRLVTSRALDYEAAQLGISVGDEILASQLADISAFQGPDGSFDREAYRFALRNAGLTEAEFEEDLRDETARTVLQGAVLSGNAMPDTYINTLLDYAGERRAFTWALLDEGALMTGLPVPSDADLQSYYEANIDAYTRPETRQITYVWLTPDMIVDTVEVDEATLRQAYEDRESEFNLPERRLVERLVFSGEAAAQEAADRIAAGETDFETLVADRGLDLADIDMGDVTLEALNDAGPEVFAAEPGTIAGPLPTALGPALFRVNGVLSAQSTPYDEAVPMLRDDLALDRARRVIETQAQSYEDLLAGGASLEDLALETDMELGRIDWTQGSTDGIAAYDNFRQAAATAQPSDFPQIEPLGDGGVFALRLDAVLPPAPFPFSEVEDRVRTGWDRQQITETLSIQAEDLAAQLREGRTFAALDIGARTEAGLTRNDAPQDLPPGLLPAVFEIDSVGDVRVVPLLGRVALVQLDDVQSADRTGEMAQSLAQLLRDQAANDMANDLFRALSADIQRRAGVEIDQAALNAVHSQMQ